MNMKGMMAAVRRASGGIAPEFYFQKAIDNSRLVRVADPRRRREIRVFSASVAALFVVMMFYAWQHFRALEYGYQIEAEKIERERLIEANRALKLEEAGLRDPGRIDLMARQLGLESPHPGQGMQLEPDMSGGPVVAQASTFAVISAQYRSWVGG